VLSKTFQKGKKNNADGNAALRCLGGASFKPGSSASSEKTIGEDPQIGGLREIGWNQLDAENSIKEKKRGENRIVNQKSHTRYSSVRIFKERGEHGETLWRVDHEKRMGGVDPPSVTVEVTL